MYRNRLPETLALVFIMFFAGLAIDPVSRQVWIAEVVPVVLVFVGLLVTANRFRFSNLAYVLMAVWLFWHTLGAHYTFANVPFDWATKLFDAERNHFDRISHFSVGFYAYAAAELLSRRRWCSATLAVTFALSLIMAIAAGYEIVEWWYAVSEGGEAGSEFLGSQGDIWDAQKDMLADTLGALAALCLFCFVRPDKRKAIFT